MAVWSSLSRSIAGVSLIKNVVKTPATLKISQNAIQTRLAGGHGPKLMPLTPSRWQWHKFKDLLHFYGMLGLIPVGLIVFYANVFIGPATLEEIPEDYVPKHWEYHRHPIQRFFARYWYPSPQQEYEKFLHNLFEEDEKAKIRLLEREIRLKMSERQDYQGYYYRPAIAKYHRASKESADYLEQLRGD